jgi:hypothetical protein
VAVLGGQEIRHQGAQADAPVGDGGGLPQPPPGPVQGVEELRQGPEQGGIQPADFVKGLDAPPGLGLLAHGIAQQHAAQAEAPGVLGGGFRPVRQVQAGALFGVQAPADVGAPQPALEARQFILAHAESAAQGRDLQQVEQVAHRQAGLGQGEQGLQGLHQGVGGPPALVGEAEGDIAGVLAVHQPEHRLDRGGIGIDVRDHDDDVARRQGGVGIEGGEQLVVEDLDLALGTVGEVEADGAIRRGSTGGQWSRVSARGRRSRISSWSCASRVGIRGDRRWTGRDRCAADGLEMALIGGPRRLLVMLVEQADEVPPLLAPGRQQGVGVQVHGLADRSAGRPSGRRCWRLRSARSRS